MFKFNFSDADFDDDESISKEKRNSTCTYALAGASDSAGSHAGEEDPTTQESAREIPLAQLVDALPEFLSYSPIVIPLTHDESGRKSVVLLRRDLFDARFQLIAQDDENGPAPGGTRVSEQSEDSRRRLHDERALDYIDNPSDLVPGVYEGGLKTWECSLDLVDCLANPSIAGESSPTWVRGKRVIEIGCGTAIPSLFLLHQLFSHPSPSQDIPATEIVLQDYNDLVLRLVTFSNILLTWYASPSAAPYRERHPRPSDDSEDDATFDPAQPGDLKITSELTSSFLSSLHEQNVTLRFVAGSWRALINPKFDLYSLFKSPFDLTLTSETIYRVSNLPILIDLLRHSLLGMGMTGRDLQAQVESLSLKTESRKTDRRPLCLVAAKVLYFGVGGGVVEFQRMVKELGGYTTVVLERKSGVGRKIIRLDWSQQNGYCIH